MTLCAAASVNVKNTISALTHCADQVEFADCLLLTDENVRDLGRELRQVKIDPLNSAEAYSEFILRDLVNHVETEHCLVVQWDGYILDAMAWRSDFLAFDYIGAPWPQFLDGAQVGNGGFSLRSRRLLEACRDSRFQGTHPEDVTICRTNRNLLEQGLGIRFAPTEVAEQFAFERSTPPGRTFGFHGIFNMIPTVGPDRFWELYLALDDRSTARIDYGLLMKQLGQGRNSLRRRTRLTMDLLAGIRRL